MKCQVLYNLREATGWISGNDLHDLFYALVGDPSPSGRDEFEPAKLKKIDKKAYQWLKKDDFSLMLATETEWRVHKMCLTIEKATTMEWSIKNNGVFPKEYSLMVVPNEAVPLMQGLEPASVHFADGVVILSKPIRYNNHVIRLSQDSPMEDTYTTAGYWQQFMIER